MDKHELDSFFRKRLENATVTPPPGAWEKIQKKQEPTRRPYYFMAAAMAALLMALPFLLQREPDVYSPRETVMEVMGDDLSPTPFIAMAEEKEGEAVKEKPTSPSPTHTTTRGSNERFTAFNQQAEEALDFIDQMESDFLLEKELQSIELIAQQLVDEKLKRMETEAMLENAWRENFTVDNNQGNNLLPAIKKFFHPDYYLSVDLDQLTKFRKQESKRSDK